MSQAAPHLRSIRPKTILVIDDDPVARNEIAEILEDEDLVPVLLESGSHALRFMQNQNWSWSPSLIITDIIMEGIGGYQLMRRVQELYPKKHVPIIVVSRLLTGDDVTEAELAGASAYLTKPINAERLMEHVARVTGKDSNARTFSSDLVDRLNDKRFRKR